jgi:hypothetical protein
MARLHSLTVWTLVFGCLTAASLYAAEPKEPRQKHAKAPAEKPKLHRSDNPFDPDGKGAALSTKNPPKPVRRELKPFRPGENVARIEAALASPTELNFTESPLQEVVDYLKEQHGIEIKIDNMGLQDVGIDASSPVTVSLKGVTLRSALNIMLRELSLTWIIEDEVLMITTPEEADMRLETKVYDVADLVVCRDDHDRLWEDYDALVEIITSTIKPTTWSETGGPGDIKGSSLGTAKVLVVSQTRYMHEEIAGLLKNIREIAKKTPNAGTPRRNRPVSPAPKKRAADIGGLRNMPPAFVDPMGVPKPKAAADAGKPSKEKQPSKPDSHKEHGGMGRF